MKLRHALLTLLACGVGIAGLADQADARGNGRGKDRQDKMNSEKVKGGQKGFRSGQGAEGAGPLADLELSDEQQAQIQELREGFRAQMEEIRDAGTRPDRETMEQIREDHRAQFEAILTSEQFEQFEQLKADRQGQGRQGRGIRGGKGGGKRGGRGGQGGGAFGGLDLTDEQKAQIQELREQMKEDFEALREQVKNGELSREDAREQVQQIREEHRQQIDALRGDEPGGPASKPTGSAIQSRSWGEIKAQMK